MLRVVSSCIESPALELFSSARLEVFKLFRTGSYSTAAPHAQTVLQEEASSSPSSAQPHTPPPPPRRPPPPPPPEPPSRRPWTVTAAALALTASLGGVYLYKKYDVVEKKKENTAKQKDGEEWSWSGVGREPEPDPSSGRELPERVQYLLVGGGTASFAALRALRSARPDATVLVAGAEPVLPYMRPPLSKELWGEPDLARRAADPHALSFRQWNGKRRPVLYEPPAFYAPMEALREGRGGAAVARGWRLARLHVERREAELEAPGCDPVTVRYDECLIATGVRPKRIPELSEVAAAGRSLALRGVRDVALLAAALERPDVKRVAIVGGGFLASELSAALAERLRPEGKSVVQVFRESAPMGGVLPEYLAHEAERRLRDAGVELLGGVEVRGARLEGGGVALQVERGAEQLEERAALVVECAGSEPNVEEAARAGLEVHEALGGLLVNAELQARAGVWAAGDVACFHDVALGRRRVEHHDHAVVSGRLAGQNMAAPAAARPYTHQSMFWSDLGPHLGYEAIGIIDSRLPTVGVFSADAVTETTSVTEATTVEETTSASLSASVAQGEARAPAEVERRVEVQGEGEARARRYERGVVFYLRGQRVVGVLLWNLFNRMHVARQVLAKGEFDDLFEVAKLFSLHEED